MRDKLKICCVASAGGHMTELLKLSDSWRKYEYFFITTMPIVKKGLESYSTVYITGECNREHPLRVLKVTLGCARAIFRERPNVVISTGAAVGCIAAYLGKLIGARVIWLDSITNVQRLSLSGWMVRRITDLFLVQWPALAQEYDKVEYAGSVL
jgi:UDP-N-acetylglucosamine:LPS N-acetylglucosamine transferase